MSRASIGMPQYRPLKVYAFDPSRGRNLNNHMAVRVPYEPLEPGPSGAYIAVVDYDASNDCYYEPVDLDSPPVLVRGGLDPSEFDPRFHQQMVYAVISETIRRFEFALGRRVKWRSDHREAGAPFKNKLLVFPHAMEDANAYYDPDMRALLFGYFAADKDEPGRNLPGQVVFTCLSHDVVVHETTHALLDGLRKFFNESTHDDTPAFHEGFADIVALLQHFSFEEALLDTIKRTAGLIHKVVIRPDADPGKDGPMLQAELTRDNPLVNLALQFGEASGMRSALRSALGTPPESRQLKDTTDAHDRGAILVAAFFDAFFTVYIRRTRDILRIARAAGLAMTGDLHPDLASRLAQEARKTADHFLNVAVRAIDYCPPVDLRFGEFLRAMITADADLVEDDPHGYRQALIDAFRSRGIVPEDVRSYSEEALLWQAPSDPVTPCPALKFDRTGDQSPRDQRDNARALHAWAVKNRKALRLNPKLPGASPLVPSDPSSASRRAAGVRLRGGVPAAERHARRSGRSRFDDDVPGRKHGDFRPQGKCSIHDSQESGQPETPTDAGGLPVAHRPRGGGQPVRWQARLRTPGHRGDSQGLLTWPARFASVCIAPVSATAF